MTTHDDLAVAAELSVDPARWRGQFEELMGRIAGRFARVEPRHMAPPQIANRGESPRRQDRIPCAITGWHGTVGIMNIEVAVPDDWTPGQAMAVRQLLQHALRHAQPVITLIRKDATAEQLQDIYRRIQEVIREAGLEA